MNRTDIEQLLDYNYWATRRVLASAERATEQKLHEAPQEGGNSIHATLMHIFGAERLWRLRCQGDSPTALPDPNSYPTLVQLVNAWQIEENAMRQYIADLSDADLAAPVLYYNTKGVAFEQLLWQILSHLVNHGTQHRAESAYHLTALGYSPGDVDFIVYLREQP